MPRTYHWSIATKHISQNKASSVRLIIAIALSTIIVAAAATVYIQARATVDQHVSSITISLFLKPEVDAKAANDLATDLAKDPVIASAVTLSPDSVRSYFNDRFGVNVAEVLPANPFPSVIRLRLKPVGLSGDNFINMVQQCRGLSSLVEEVSYPSDVVRIVLNEVSILWWSAIFGGAILFCAVLALLFFALKAEGVYSKDDANVVSLLGAKRSFLGRSTLLRNMLLAFFGVCLGGAKSIFLLMYLSTIHITMPDQLRFLIPVFASAAILLLVIVLNRRSIPSA